MTTNEMEIFAMNRWHWLVFAFSGSILSGCLNIADTASVPCAAYETVAQSFLMLAREDVADGKSTWSQGSGVARISTWV